jgi:GT2 family glycosyltransferase
MSISNSGSVGAVVVTYNRSALLNNCLDALLAQSRPPDRIYVVDNASTDGTAEMIAGAYRGRVVYERLAVNSGGAGGFHHGTRVAYASGHEWIWLMDDDVAPAQDCLARLLAAADRTPRRIAVPLRETPAGRLMEDAAIWFDLDAPWCRPGSHCCSVIQKYKVTEAVPASLALQSFAFEGPLIPADVVRAVGLPSVEFFVFCDDTDYALRAQRAGFEIVLARDARLRRMLERGRRAAWLYRYSNRNPLWINRLHGHSRAVRTIRNYSWAVFMTIFSILRMADPSRWSELGPRLRGIVEGLWAPLPTANRTSLQGEGGALRNAT